MRQSPHSSKPPGRRKTLTDRPQQAGLSKARQTIEAIRAAQASAFKSRPMPQLRVIGTPEATATA